MIGYPFDSQVTFDAQGNPQYDRAVSSKPLKELIKKLFTTGVMPNPSTNLQVVEGVSGLTTIVKAGFCIIEGGLKLEEEDKTMMHQAADTTYDRIDTVVMRWNDNDNARICALYVLAGTPSATPVRPTLNREGSVYEIGLADVLIKANSTAISQQRITDTRYETERCGVISSISEFDTDTIYAQVQADLAGFKTDEEADFLAWFDEMKDQLSEDAAGNLQNQIGLLSNLETTNKDSLVGAINEVKNATPDDMTGATALNPGTHGLVPAPQAGDEDKVLKGDGTWGTAGDASTVRYNALTDMVQIWDALNQVWVDRWYGGLRNLPYFYKAGSEILSGWNVYVTDPNVDPATVYSLNSAYLYLQTGGHTISTCLISNRTIKMDNYSTMHIVFEIKSSNANYDLGINLGISQRGGNTASEIVDSFTAEDVYLPSSQTKTTSTGYVTKTYDLDVSGKTGDWWFKAWITGWYAGIYVRILELSFT